MNDETRLAEFRTEVRSWLAEAIPDEWRHHRAELSVDETIELRRQWGKQIHAAGFAGIAMPVEYGGRGLGPVELTIFHEECAMAHAPEPLNRLGLNLAGPAIAGNGTEEQKRRFLPGILNGEDIWCEGFSEPNAGSDLAAVKTTAVRDGDRWLISGNKIWTSLAHLADHCYLLARSAPDAPRHQNLTVFLIDMHQPGVEVRPLRHLSGVAEFNEVYFDNIVATDADVLGEVHDGWRLGTIGSKAMRAGSMATTGWHHYAKMQEWIDQIRACQTECGRSGVDTEQLQDRLDVYRSHIGQNIAVFHEDEDWIEPLGASNVSKVYWSKLYVRCAESGYALGCARHRDYWRDAFLESRAAPIYGGSVQIQRNVITDQVLGLRKR